MHYSSEHFIYVGYLCGQCRNGKGVSALLNNCVSCERTSVLLIIALGTLCIIIVKWICIYVYISVIVDIIVITTILLCSLSLKPWLYPFLFYLQVHMNLSYTEYYIHT